MLVIFRRFVIIRCLKLQFSLIQFCKKKYIDLHRGKKLAEHCIVWSCEKWRLIEISQEREVHCKETPTQGFGKIWEPSRLRIILESRQSEESVLLRVWAAIVTGHLPHNRSLHLLSFSQLLLRFSVPSQFWLAEDPSRLHWWVLMSFFHLSPHC